MTVDTDESPFFDDLFDPPPNMLLTLTKGPPSLIVRDPTNPKSCGATCDACPLRERKPVLGVGPAQARLVIVGEGPGFNEDKEGVPFIGKSGQMLTEDLLAPIEVARDDVWITNAALCLPTDDASKRVSAANCKTRLLTEVDEHIEQGGVVVAVGNLALQSLCGVGGISARRGAVHKLQLPSGKRVFVIPTFHPAYLMRDNWQELSVVKRDFQRALAVANGARPFAWGYSRDVEDLLEICNADTGPVGFDVETTREPPTLAALKSIAVATAEPRLGFVTPWPATPQVQAILASLFSREDKVKAAHNAAFDLVVLRRHGFVFGGQVLDTMILHHLAEPDHAHDLGYVTSDVLLVDPWKEEFREAEDEVFGHGPKRKAILEAQPRREAYREALGQVLGLRSLRHGGKEERKTWKTAVSMKNKARKAWSASREALKELAEVDRQLLDYNAKDAQATAAIAPGLLARTEDVKAVRDVEHALLPIAVRMTEVGLLVDPAARDQVRGELMAREDSALVVLREAAGAEFRPHVPVDRQRLLYDVAKLPVRLRTKTRGDPSTAREALLDYSDNPIVAALLDYDAAHKLRSTFVEKLEIGKLLEADGRLHPTWTVGAQVSGRMTSRVNCQNWHTSMRKMVVADPGHVFIAVDFAQLEYRIMAALAGCKKLLDIFNTPGADAHAIVASEIFGTRFTGEQDPKVKKALRALGKKTVHASDYGAQTDTIVRGIRRDPHTEPEIKKLATPEVIGAILRGFETKYPEIPVWRRAQVESARSGFLTTPPLGRTRVFASPRNVPATICYNWPIQSAATDIVSLATLRVASKLPPDAAIVLNKHDEIMVLCPVEKADEVKAMMISEMRSRFEGVVDLEVDAHVGTHWGEV